MTNMTPKPTTKKNYDFNVLNILVVEDSEHMRTLLTALLGTMGVGCVTSAKNGSEGLLAYHEIMPDIVITDGTMAPIDGYELTRRIRMDTTNPNPFVPIIMLSGHVEQTRVALARDTGVTEYLAKPVSANTLYERLVSVIENPRTFVRLATYFGPDRRRQNKTFFIGNQQRATDTPAKSITRAQAAASDKKYNVKYITPPNYLLAKVTPSSATTHLRKNASAVKRAFSRHKGDDMTQLIAHSEDSFIGLIQEEISHIRSLFWLIEHRNDGALEKLYTHVHDIRGIADAFKYDAISSIARSLCTYLSSLSDPYSVDLGVLRPHVNALISAFIQGRKTTPATQKVIKALETLSKVHRNNRAA